MTPIASEPQLSSKSAVLKNPCVPYSRKSDRTKLFAELAEREAHRNLQKKKKSLQYQKKREKSYLGQQDPDIIWWQQEGAYLRPSCMAGSLNQAPVSQALNAGAHRGEKHGSAHLA